MDYIYGFTFSLFRYLQLSDLDKFDIVTQELDEIQKLSAIKEDVYNKFNAAHEVKFSML